LKNRRLSAHTASLLTLSCLLMSCLLIVGLAPVGVHASGAAGATGASGAAEPGVLAVGENFPVRPLTDQHENPVNLGSETELVLLSFDMALSKSMHGFLSEKEPDYLATHSTQYVSDIAKMPKIITFLFAGPKMRKYPFPIILNEADDFGPLFPQQEDKITAIKLDGEGTV
jgi:hypothetical protein